MFEYLVANMPEDLSELYNPDVPPPVDTARKPLSIVDNTYVNGTTNGDYYGNQFQFNFDGTMLLAPSYGRIATEICKLNETDFGYTKVGNLAVKFGAAGSDDFSVVHSFGGSVSPSVFYKNSLDNYVKVSMTAATNAFDNWQISPTGKFYSDKSGVFTIDKTTGAARKVLTSSTDGFVFSENDKVAVAVVGGTRLVRWNIEGVTFTSVSTTDLPRAISSPGTAGLEIGYNYDLSRIVYVNNGFGATVMRFNPSTNKYEQMQTVTDYKGIGDMSVSMDRSGGLFTYSFGKSMSKLPIYQLDKSTNTYVASLLIDLQRFGDLWSHKVKLSPNGKYVGMDELYWNSTWGRIRIVKLYD